MFNFIMMKITAVITILSLSLIMLSGLFSLWGLDGVDILFKYGMSGLIVVGFIAFGMITFNLFDLN